MLLLQKSFCILHEFVIDSSLLEIYLDYIIVCACELPCVIISAGVEFRWLGGNAILALEIFWFNSNNC